MHKTMGRQGIAILHAGAQTARVLRAGRTAGNGGTDFSWMDIWSVYSKQTAQQGGTRKKSFALLGDALLVHKIEAASVLLYWNGTAYRWSQQGD